MPGEKLGEAKVSEEEGKAEQMGIKAFEPPKGLMMGEVRG